LTAHSCRFSLDFLRMHLKKQKTFEIYFAQGCQYFKPPKWTLLLRKNMASHFKTEKTDFGYLGPIENEAQKWQK
jgi:hypothetical protein